jgi:hypothetical protein
MRKGILLASATLGFLAIEVAGADYKSTVLADTPATYWRFSETGVTPTIDYATNRGTFGFPGYGYYVEGAVHGVPGALASDPLSTGALMPNVNGGSGGPARVRIPWQSDLNGYGAFSVEFWAKPAVTGAIACPASSVDFNAATRYGWLFYQGPGSLSDGNGWFFRLYHATGNTVAAVGIPLDTNHWYHVVGTFDGASTIKLYVDGAPVATNTLAAAYTPNVNRSDVPMTFGGRGDGAAGNYGWGGSMDETAYYTNALTDAEVLAHYQAGTNPTPATAYSTLVENLKPAVYLRLNEPAYVLPVAVNQGTLGAAANGGYNYWSETATGLSSPAFPGFEADNRVLQTSTTNGFVSAPPLNLNTNRVTFECWLRRNGDQASYNGVIFHRGSAGGTASGIMFRDSAVALNNLGYHWNDTQYAWDSGLIPPDGLWTYVALAVSPDQAVMYMYDGTTWSSAVNTVAHAPQAFAATTRIGTDSGASRFFNGLIDEAAIYGYTLTEGQLRTHALAGFGDSAHKAPTFVTDPPALSPSGTIYTTTPFAISADVYGEPPLTFQWQHDGTNVPGATAAVFSRASASANDAGPYLVVVGNPNGSVTSSIVNVVINAAVPPTITDQPASRTVYPGGTASFTVTADGTPPFTYQWKHAGTNLPGATNATLFVSNCGAAETGSYSVGVTNVAGGRVSGSASLTLRTPTPGSFEERVVTNGPAAYWRLGETSGTIAYDYAGGNDGTYVSVAQGQPGSVLGDSNGSAGFDGTSSYVTTGRGLLNNRSQFTVMGWLKRGANHSGRGGYFGQNNLLEFGDANSGTSIEAWIDATSGNIVTPWPWPDDQWGFIVLTGNGTANILYIDGQPVATRTSSVSSYGTNEFAFNIGGGGIFNATGDYFNGFIDEVAVYNKALSPETIADLYSSGLFGATTPPFVTRNPVSQTVAAGATLTLTAGANGSIPLTYQWKKDGVNVTGATSSTLNLTNVYFTEAGSYVLWVTNSAGVTNTTAATISVMAPPSYANLTNGLVLHLPFDGSYADTSGKGNNASAPGGDPPFVPGRIGQGVHIATTPNVNYLAVSDSSSDLGFDETESFTVSFWIKYTGSFNDVPIIGNAINSTWQLGWVFTDSATAGKIEWSLVSTANTGTYLRDPVPGCPTINDNKWHNVIGVVDRTENLALVYVDGAFTGSWSIAGLGTLDTAQAITIGQDPTGGYGSTTFDLDDLGIWRKALNAYEVSSLYAASQNGLSFDVTGPVKVYLKATAGPAIDLSWQSGSLLQSSSVNGTFTPVPGAVAPYYRTSPTNSAMFFRVGP